MTDERGVVLHLEPSFTRLLGWRPAQIAGHRIGELAHRDDLKHCLRSWVHLRQGSSEATVRMRCHHSDGHWVWMDVTCHNLLATRKEIFVDMVDVHREVELLELLTARDQLLTRVGDLASVGAFCTDLSGRVLYANRALQTMSGVSAATTLGEQLAVVAEPERPGFVAAIRLALDGTTTTADVETVRGRWRVRLSPVVAPTGEVRGVAGCIEEHADSVAPASGPAYDPLTGALTREATIAALGEIIKSQAPAGTAARSAEARRRDGVKGTACIVVKLRTLEPLLLRHGREARDEVLSLVGLRVRDSIRSSDLLGRTGEDELAVLCARVTGTTAALSICQAMLAQITQPMTLSTGLAVTVRPGIGVDWVDAPGSPPEQVLARSQAAALESTTSEVPEPVLVARVGLAPERTTTPTTAASGAFGAGPLSSPDEAVLSGVTGRRTFDEVLPSAGTGV